MLGNHHLLFFLQIYFHIMETRLVSHGSSATLQDRLARRRRFHQKKLSSESSLSQSPITRSLDRSSSQRSTSDRRAIASLPSSTTPSAPRKVSATRLARYDLPHTQPLPPKENPVAVHPPTHRTVVLPQPSPRGQSFGNENRQSLQAQQRQEKVEENREIVSTNPPLPSERTRSRRGNQPLVLPPVRNGVEIPLRRPSSHSESHTDSDAPFQFPSLPPRTVSRTTSEQILSSHRNNSSSLDRSLIHQRSLALSYVLNRRAIDTQFISTSASNIDENQHKTVWD